jgi:ribosomal protein S18 acetylase RimI-like enzyme
MEIRRMKAEDLPAAAGLYLAAYAAEWPAENAENYLRKFFAFEPESCLVAVEDDGALAGAILGYSFEKETGLTLFIQELYVHPDSREKGYGRKLVTRLRDTLSKKASVKVKPLVKADTGVLNFYNSLGFERGKAVSFSFDED